jgi:hypothetical protein
LPFFVAICTVFFFATLDGVRDARTVSALFSLEDPFFFAFLIPVLFFSASRSSRNFPSFSFRNFSLLLIATVGLFGFATGLGCSLGGTISTISTGFPSLGGFFKLTWVW